MRIGTTAAALAVSIFSLTCSASIARADIITGSVIGTNCVPPLDAGCIVTETTVLSQGEHGIIDAFVNLVAPPMDQPFFYNGISWSSDYGISEAGMTLYDGMGNSRSKSDHGSCFFGPCAPSSIYIDWDPIVYPEPGTFFPHYTADFILRYVAPIRPGCPITDGLAYCLLFYDISYTGSTTLTVTAVPGPIAGAGLPGLVFALGGAVAWWRRRQQAGLTCH